MLVHTSLTLCTFSDKTEWVFAVFTVPPFNNSLPCSLRSINGGKSQNESTISEEKNCDEKHKYLA